MGKRLYVGNLPYQVDEDQLRALFEQDGRQVEEIKIVTDRETGRARGFAFVEMATDAQAQAAVNALHGKPFGGRPLTVSEARERAPNGSTPRSGCARRASSVALRAGSRWCCAARHRSRSSTWPVRRRLPRRPSRRRRSRRARSAKPWRASSPLR